MSHQRVPAEPTISSRYNDAEEFTVMRAALALIRPADRRKIREIFTDSKGGWITLTLASGVGRRTAARVGAAYHRAVTKVTGVYAVVDAVAGDFSECFDGGPPGSDEERPEPAEIEVDPSIIAWCRATTALDKVFGPGRWCLAVSLKVAVGAS